MKVNEVDIFIIPDDGGADEDHWQSRWTRKLSTAQRVGQAAWSKPALEERVTQLVGDVKKAEKPAVLVAHALGVLTAVHAAACLGPKVRGGFFVAPPDITSPGKGPGRLMTIPPYPRGPLPFPSTVIASRNDPCGNFAKAEALSQNWRSLFLDAGQAGHINSQSGHGPWPEGLMVFSQFLANL